MNLVLGATGSFGGAVMRALLARGERVRVLARREATWPDGVEVVRGDALAMPELLEAAKGCDVIYQGLSVPMGRWARELTVLHDNAVEASGLTGATLVMLQSLHGMRPVHGVPLPADPVFVDPFDRVGQLVRHRIEMESQLEQNTALRAVRSVVVRACDLVGPGVASGYGGEVVAAIRAGRPVPWFAPGRLGHAFTSVEDAAHVAVALADGPPHYVLANAPSLAVANAAEWGRTLTAAAGRPVAVRVIPRWWMTLRALANPDARAFVSAPGPWDGPLELDLRRTRELLPGWEPRALAAALEGFVGGR